MRVCLLVPRFVRGLLLSGKARRRAFIIFGAWLVFAVCFPIWCLSEHYVAMMSRCLEVSQSPERADVIVVPSGDDIPRLAEAADLYHKGYAPKILLTGFENPHALAARFARDNQIPQGALIVEPDAGSTFENATHSAPLLRKNGVRRVMLVTSWYHSRRALQTFRRVMPDIRFISVPTRIDYWPTDRKRLTLEFSKLCYYGIAHRVSPW